MLSSPSRLLLLGLLDVVAEDSPNIRVDTDHPLQYHSRQIAHDYVGSGRPVGSVALDGVTDSGLFLPACHRRAFICKNRDLSYSLVS